MSYKIPFTFIPGTKAKANEVNSNFSKIIDYLTDINGSIVETNTQVGTLSTNLNATNKKFNEAKTKLCVNSSTGTLITLSGSTLYFNSEFVITDISGESTTISNVSPISTLSFQTGTYNIFIGKDSLTETLNNKIYRQEIEPTTKSTNDIWIDTSSEPIKQKKWNGGSWENYEKIAIGSIEITAEGTKTITAFPFNQNGYNINSNSELSLKNISEEGRKNISKNSIIDYSKKVTKAWNTLYSAESDGFLFIRGVLSDNKDFKVDIGETNTLGNTVVYTKITDVNNVLQMFVPIPKGYYYKISGSGGDSGTVFYPTKGAN